ncbi:hypothetical protein [Mycolicibacterium goodii]|uniref:hypothetical protein n=1 Tax=Mycolicibacterium goodii TaxID=134601 RepID=UPI0013042048|nr:hypothetical protein [Mycolicibacterium goodii]
MIELLRNIGRATDKSAGADIRTGARRPGRPGRGAFADIDPASIDVSATTRLEHMFD